MWVIFSPYWVSLIKLLQTIKTVIYHKQLFSALCAGLEAQSWDWCSCCSVTLQFPQCVVTLIAAISIPKPELFDRKLCLVSQQTAVFTPYTIIFITVTTIPGVCAWVGHPACSLTSDRCSIPVRHLNRITWYPPSVRTNAIISIKQNRVITLIFNKLFTVWRDSGETRQLRQTCSCVMNVTWVITFTAISIDLLLSRQLHFYQSCHRRLWMVPGFPRHLDQWRNFRLHCRRIFVSLNRKYLQNVESWF